MDTNGFFKALSDDTRLAIVTLLKQQGEMCVCDIYGCLALSQPKVSRHLALLRERGVVQDNRRGAWVYYRLHDGLPDWASKVIAEAAGVVSGTEEFKSCIQRLSNEACC